MQAALSEAALANGAGTGAGWRASNLAELIVPSPSGSASAPWCATAERRGGCAIGAGTPLA